MTNQPELLSVASVDMFLEAQLWIYHSYSALHVLMSPMISDLDPCYEPVNEVLGNTCCREVDWELIESDEWALGKAHHTEYQVFATCPGSKVPHLCVFQRVGFLRDMEGTR